MARGSRHKSHKQNRHGRGHSDSEEDARAENNAREGATLRVSKDSNSVERRKLVSQSKSGEEVFVRDNTNGHEEYSNPKNGGRSSDRWNGDPGNASFGKDAGDLGKQSKSSSAAESRSKGKRTHENPRGKNDSFVDDDEKNKAGKVSSKRKPRKELKNGDRGNGKERKPEDSKRDTESARSHHEDDKKPDHRSAPDSKEQKSSRSEKPGYLIPTESRNPELEKELDKRMRRREGGYPERERYYGSYEKDSNRHAAHESHHRDRDRNGGSNKEIGGGSSSSRHRHDDQERERPRYRDGDDQERERQRYRDKRGPPRPSPDRTKRHHETDRPPQSLDKPRPAKDKKPAPPPNLGKPDEPASKRLKREPGGSSGGGWKVASGWPQPVAANGFLPFPPPPPPLGFHPALFPSRAWHGAAYPPPYWDDPSHAAPDWDRGVAAAVNWGWDPSLNVWKPTATPTATAPPVSTPPAPPAFVTDEPSLPLPDTSQSELRAFLLKLDISDDLALPELFQQCADIIGPDTAASDASDEVSFHNSDISSGPTDGSAFRKAMGLYEKLKEESKGSCVGQGEEKRRDGHVISTCDGVVSDCDFSKITRIHQSTH